MILITGLRYYAQYNFLSSLLSESESESEPTVTVNLVLLPLLSRTPATPATPATRRYLGVAQVEFVRKLPTIATVAGRTGTGSDFREAT